MHVYEIGTYILYSLYVCVVYLQPFFNVLRYFNETYASSIIGNIKKNVEFPKTKIVCLDKI